MNIMRNAFKRANYVLCLLLALSGTSCINRLNDEIKEGSILISFSFEASKAATKVTKNTFDIGDRSGIFAMLTGNSLDQQRYIDNLLLECSDNSKLISKKCIIRKEMPRWTSSATIRIRRKTCPKEAHCWTSQYKQTRTRPPITAYPTS